MRKRISSSTPETTYNELEILEIIGGGGYGVVYKCEHLHWGTVAYKKLKVITEDSRELLRKEADIQYSMKHSNIVKLLAVIDEPENCGLVLEFMEHGELIDFLRENRSGWEKKHDLVYDIALGMCYLHTQTPPIIHGDLKIQNILIGTDLRSKVSDFGFSNWKEHSMSISMTTDPKATVKGTVTHIPPEHWNNPSLKKGKSFDIYGFGIVMWEVMTEMKPYLSNITAQIRVNVMNGHRPDMLQIPDDVYPTDIKVMENCWHGMPEVRPQFSEIKQRLEKFERQEKRSISFHFRIHKTVIVALAVAIFASFIYFSVYNAIYQIFFIVPVVDYKNYVPPVIVVGPDPYYVFSGKQSLLLPCFVRGTETIIYEWLFNGFPLNMSSEGVEMSDGYLRLDPVAGGQSRQGYYQCIAHNHGGTGISNIILVEEAVLKSANQEAAVDVTARPNEQLILPCSHILESKPKIVDFLWRSGYDDSEVPSAKDGKRIVIAENGSLIFSYVQTQDSSNYSCVAFNRLLNESRTGSEFVLVVQGEEVSLSPVLLYISPNTTTVEGRREKFTCLIGGQADIYDVEWKKLKESGSVHVGYGMLSFPVVNISDSGTYVCSLKNCDDCVLKAAIELSVDVLPSCTRELVSQNFTVDRNLMFFCKVLGHPVPEVEWYVNGSLVTASEYITIKTESSDRNEITFVNFQSSFSVSCNVSNKHGYRLYSAYAFFISLTDLKSKSENPTFVWREQWGARVPKNPPTPLLLPVNITFIHHTAGTWDCQDLESCVRQVQSIQDLHMDTRGWDDIGYSFLIGGDGRVYEGRGWGAVGAHTLGYNTMSLAFCFIGDFSQKFPSEAALDAGKQAIEFGVLMGYISSDYELFGHRDARDTESPGSYLYNIVQTWPNYSKRYILNKRILA